MSPLFNRVYTSNIIEKLDHLKNSMAHCNLDNPSSVANVKLELAEVEALIKDLVDFPPDWFIDAAKQYLRYPMSYSYAELWTEVLRHMSFR